MVNYAGAGTITGDGLVAALGTGLANGWATPGNEWAITDGANVVAQTVYTLKSAANTTAANYAGKDVKIENAAGMVWNGAIAPNSLLWTTLSTPTLAANSTNLIGSGGIMFSSTIGQNNASGLNGNGAATLSGPAGGELIVFQNNNATSTKIPYISAIIVDNNTVATGLTKAGAYQLDLRAVNTYTGNTTINAGTLAITGAGQLGGGDYAASIILNGGTFLYANSADQTLSGVISGAGVLRQSGPGALTLVNANTYTGTTTVTGGELNLDAGGTPAFGGNLTVSGGTAKLLQSDQIPAAKNGVVSGGTLDLNGNSNHVAGVQITGGLSLSIGSDGVVVLSSALSAAGATLGQTTSDAARVHAVPEPAPLALLIAGAAGLGAAMWRRRVLPLAA